MPDDEYDDVNGPGDEPAQEQKNEDAMVLEKPAENKESTVMIEENPQNKTTMNPEEEINKSKDPQEETKAPTGQIKSGFDEQKLPGKGSYLIEEEPKKIKSEERPLTGMGSYKIPNEDRPLTAKGTYSFGDEKPISGKGAYNLDGLGEAPVKNFDSNTKPPRANDDEIPIKGKGIYNIPDENELLQSSNANLSSMVPKKVLGAKKKPNPLPQKKAQTTEKMQENNENAMIEEEPRPTGFKASVTKDDVPLTGKGSYNIVEEQPVGSGQPSAVGLDEFGTNEPKRPVELGPLSSRVKSKAFQSRMTAFEELRSLFENTESSNDHIFSEYGREMHKFIADTMPAPQEKACGALKVFLEKSKEKGNGLEYGLCTKGLLEKCLGGGKPNVIGVANECIVLLFETAEDKQVIFENIIWAINHKNQKVTVAGIGSICTLLTNFGPQRLDFLKPFYPHIEKAAANTNASIRNEAMTFYKEAYKWIGDALKNYMSNLKKTQIDELEKHFSENPRVPIAPLRGGAITGVGCGPAKAVASGGKANEAMPMMDDIDPYDMADPVDIFKHFNEAWTEKTLAIAKWNEKKTALEEFLKAASLPKITGNYAHITQMVKKLFMDTNVAIQMCGIKILGSLAKGMRKGFAHGAKIYIEPVLSKIKDKKPQIVEETFVTLENFFYCITLEDMIEDIKNLSTDKNVSMRSGLMRLGDIYFVRCIGKGPNVQAKVKNGIKGFVPIAKKLLEDSTPDVKEAAVNTLRILLANFEDDVGSMIDDVNQQKLAKIKDMSKLAAPANEAEMKSTLKNTLNSTVGFSKTPKSGGKPALHGKEEPKAVKGFSATVNASQGEEIPPSIPVDEAESLLTSMGIPENALVLIYNVNWKEKINGIEAIKQFISEQPNSLKTIIEPVLAVLKKGLKNWKESTLMLNKEVFSFVCDMVQNSEAVLTKGAWALGVGLVVEKSIDSKFFESCYSITRSFCQYTSPKFTSSILLKEAHDSGPKSLAETCKLFIKIQEEFGAKGIPLHEAVNFAKATILNTNTMARSAGLGLLKELYKHNGESVKSIIGDIGGALQKTIESELGTVQVSKEAVFSKTMPNREVMEETMKKKTTGAFDLVPRSDISGEVNKLLKQINDKNQWKVRKDAVERLDQLITSAKGKILPNGLNELVTSLKARMTDSNKSVARNYIGFVGRFAEALGKDFKPFAKTLLGPLIMSLSDRQAILKAEVLNSIDKMVPVIGLDLIFSMMLPSLATENPDLRVDVITWMLKNPDGFAQADLKGNIHAILSVAQDKTKEVKALIDPLFEKCIEIIGPEPFKAAMQDMKVAVAQLITPIIDKHSPHDPNETEKGSRLAKNKSANTLSPNKNDEDGSSASQRSHTPNHFLSSGSKQKDNQDSAFSPSFGNGTQAEARPNKFSMKYTGENEQSEPRFFNTGPVSLGSNGKNQTRMMEEEKYGENLSQKKTAFNSHQIIYPFGTRAERDLGFGTWNIDELFDDQIDFLKELIMQGIHPKTAAPMFSYETKKILDATESLKQALNNEWAEFVEIADLVVKWVFFRLMQNGSVSSNCGILRLTTAFIEKISFSQLSKVFAPQSQTVLTEGDCRILLSCLFRKTSSRSEGERNEAAKALKALSKVHSPEILYQCIIRSLENEKEGAVTLGYIEMLSDLAKDERGSRAISAADVRLISEIVWSPYPNLKQGALSLLKIYYQVLGNKLLDALKMAPIQPEKKEQLLSALFGTQSLSESKPTLELPINQMKPKPNGTQAAMAVQDRLSFGSSPNQIPSSEKPKLNSNSSAVQSTPEAQVAPFSEGPQTPGTLPKKPALDSFRANLQHMIHGDGTMIFDSLMYIQDLIVVNDEEYKSFIQANASQLIAALLAVMTRIFEKSRKDITSKYIQYYLNVLHRVCTCKFVFTNISSGDLMNLLDELLRRLLSESEAGDESAETSKTDLDVHVKLLNSTILRVLENSNTQDTFLVLIDLLIKHRRQTTFGKIIGLIVKCTLKLTKVMDSIIHSLNKEQLLLRLHDYLCEFAPDPSRPSDDIGIKTIKTILNEMIKIMGNEIWNVYTVIEEDQKPDHYLKRWISLILKPNQPVHSPRQSEGTGEFHSLQMQRERRVANNSGVPTVEDILKLMEKYKKADFSNSLDTAQLDVTLAEMARKQPSSPSFFLLIS